MNWSQYFEEGLSVLLNSLTNSIMTQTVHWKPKYKEHHRKWNQTYQKKFTRMLVPQNQHQESCVEMKRYTSCYLMTWTNYRWDQLYLIYQQRLTKHFLSPLGKSKYPINCSKQFVNYVRKQTVSKSYQMVSFCVTFLFTNMPLHEIIDIILHIIYKERKSTPPFLNDKWKICYTYVQKIYLLVLTIKFLHRLME